MSTLQGMQRLLAERLGVDESEITPDRTLESFGIDSLGKLELLFHIEEAFGIRLVDDGACIVTLGQVVSTVERELGRQK